MQTTELDILDVLLVLAKHKKFIFLTVIIISIISVIYSLVTPQIWSSTAVIAPVKNDDNDFSFSGSSLLGLGSAILGNSSSNSAQEFITIMKSRTFTDKVIEKFNLIELFKIKESDAQIAKEIARELLREKYRDISFDDDAGVIVIEISTVDKEISKEIANYYWQELELYNQKYNITSEKRKRIFIEKRLIEVEENITNLGNKLKEFMEDNNAIELESQTKAIISLYSDIISQKFNNDIELGIAKKIYNEKSIALEKLELLNSEIIQKIEQLEYNEKKDISYTLNLKDIPALSLEYTNIMLNLNVQKSIYEFLYPQFEQAKIQEVKDFPTIKIIDEAEIAGRRSKPKRAKLCITNFIVALFMSIFVAFLIDFIQSKKEKTTLLKDTLFNL